MRAIAARRLVQKHCAQVADKSVFAIPYQDFVEVHHLPVGSNKEWDRTVEVTYEDDSLSVFRSNPSHASNVKLIFCTVLVLSYFCNICYNM